MDESSERRPVVLIVEDDGYIRTDMKRAMEAHGFRVLEAIDEATAAEAAESDAPDVILTEEDVPAFAALTERARRPAALKDVPVAIVNPDAEEGARQGDAILFADYDQLNLFVLRSQGVIG